MNPSPSKSAANRQTGKHQVDEQRACILETAEKRFLENGLENTSMVDIADHAGITRVTLYRYFANRDEIAVEIQVRMLEKITTAIESTQDSGLEYERQRVRAMIRNFPHLRDAFRYIGMFDKIYLDNLPDTLLTQWAKRQITELRWGASENRGRPDFGDQAYENQLAVIRNTVVWFLEKLALRGELTWSENVPLEEHLKVFEDLIMGYFDRLMHQTPE
jgi:AcrR family transcriptional regulator